MQEEDGVEVDGALEAVEEEEVVVVVEAGLVEATFALSVR